MTLKTHVSWSVFMHAPHYEPAATRTLCGHVLKTLSGVERTVYDGHISCPACIVKLTEHPQYANFLRARGATFDGEHHE